MSLVRDMVDRIDDRLARQKPIDYKRMNALWPKQKAALTRAKKRVEATRPKNNWDLPSPEYTAACEALAAVCKKAVREWDECGAWPDDWRLFERALEDALPWGTAVDLRYL